MSRESVNTSYRVGISTNTESKNILLFDALTNSNGSPFGGFAQVLSLQQDGNVGIGTRTPGSRLSVSGDIDITGNRLHVNATSGNVGIGTNNPQARLDVRETNGGLALQVLDDREVVIGPFISAQNPNVTLYFGDDRNHYIQSNWNKGLSFSTYGAVNAMVIQEITGKVGIGVGLAHTFGEGMLEVNGTVRSKKFVAEMVNWPDYVLCPQYRLRPLQEVESYIHKHGHLPEIPSALEIEKNGLDLGELIRLQMQKIEELTLYVIALEKKLNEKCGE